MAKAGPGMGLKLEPKSAIRQMTVKIVRFSEGPFTKSSNISLCACPNRFLTDRSSQTGFFVL